MTIGGGILYEYRCPRCEQTRELWRAIRDRDEPPTCDADPDCLGTLMFRTISAPSIRGETVSKR